MKRARDIIPDLFHADDAPASEAADWVPALWPAAAGEALARRTRPVDLRNGVLYVETAGVEWVDQLRRFEVELRRRLNEQAGGSPVRRIVFRPGWVPLKPARRAQSAEDVKDPLRRAVYQRSKGAAERA